MPSPWPEGLTSDVEDVGAESSGDRENTAAGDGAPSPTTPQWTEEDWRQWTSGTAMSMDLPH